MRFRLLLRQPSAFLPPALSLCALAVVAAYLARYGVMRQPDEGAAAHLWQLLMGIQVPIMAWFALRWLPRAPKQAAGVLGLQVCAALLAAAPVFLLEF